MIRKQVKINEIHCLVSQKRSYGEWYNLLKKIDDMFEERFNGVNKLFWKWDGDNWTSLSQADGEVRNQVLCAVGRRMHDVIMHFPEDNRNVARVLCTVPDESFVFYNAEQGIENISIKLTAWGCVYSNSYVHPLGPDYFQKFTQDNPSTNSVVNNKTIIEQDIISEIKEIVAKGDAVIEDITPPKQFIEREEPVVVEEKHIDVHAGVPVSNVKHESHEDPGAEIGAGDTGERKKIFQYALLLIVFLIGLLLPSPLFRNFVNNDNANDDKDAAQEVVTVDTTNIELDDGVYSGGVIKNTKIRNGYGRYETRTGVIYEGNWDHDILVYGIKTSKSYVYEGNFDSDLSLDGFGIVRYSDDYINGKRNQGMTDSEIISFYVGNWRKDYKHGIGRAIKQDGSMEFGIYKEGHFQKVDGANFRVGGNVYGIDVSHYQSRIDWNNVALYCDKDGNVYRGIAKNKSYMQPVFFVYIKATEGATIKDDKYTEMSYEVERHGMVKGAYHFLHLGSPINAQLKNFFETVSWTHGDLPPALDIELENEIKKYGVDSLQSMALRWLEEVEKKLGVKPIIYTRESIRNKYLNNPKFEKYQVWISRYSEGPQNFDWQFWQMTEKGDMNGYNADIDINLFRGDFDAFTRYIGGY